MQPFFENCIFCHRRFSGEEVERSREHVVPDLLLGSVQIWDVCRECNSKLGKEVDHLLLRESRIINAIDKLNIRELKQKIVDAGETTGIDSIDGRELKAQYYQGTPKILPQRIDPDGIESSEDDALDILYKLVNRDERLLWSQEERKKYIDTVVWPENNEMAHGESRSYPLIGRRIVKRKIEKFVTTPKHENNVANRLAAKIVYEVCHYALDMKLLQLVERDLNAYGEYAYSGGSKNKALICLRDSEEHREPAFYHLIQILHYPHFIAIDIDFFNSVNFRGVLFPQSGYDLPVVNGHEAEGIGIAMTFKPNLPRSKTLAIRRKDSGKWIEYQMTDL